jgi:hypothetical protein
MDFTPAGVNIFKTTTARKSVISPFQTAVQSAKRLALANVFVGNGKFFATFCAARCKHPASIGGFHPAAEAMLVLAFPVVRLKCPFHELFCFYLFLLNWVAKVILFSEITKKKSVYRFFCSANLLSEQN